MQACRQSQPACQQQHHAAGKQTVLYPPITPAVTAIPDYRQQPYPSTSYQQSCTSHSRQLVMTWAGKGFGAPKATPSNAAQTCSCGSRVVYKDCCEPYHSGAAQPANIEAALRARFCAFVRGKEDYIVGTFHPQYHCFKYGAELPGGAAKQLELDVSYAVRRYAFSRLKVLSTEAGSQEDEQFVTFSYDSVGKMIADKSNKSGRREKSQQHGARNLDGSLKVARTIERSRFMRTEGGQWLFADYELLEYPEHMVEAKEAELRARGQQPLGEETTTAAAASWAKS